MTAPPPPLTERDSIAVGRYNAQVDRLAAAGLGGVSVGSMDKFQGHEAVISIVSLAASSAVEVPWHRVPADAEPPQRGDLAGNVGGVPGALPRAGGPPGL